MKHYGNNNELRLHDEKLHRKCSVRFEGSSSSRLMLLSSYVIFIVINDKPPITMKQL